MIIKDSSRSISILFIVFLSTFISNGLSSVVSRQKRADECPNPENNACLFGFCDNGGTCVEDPTIAECYRCQCPAGYTGRICESLAVVTPTGCNPACINGGTCNNNVCYCPLGFFGVYCEQKDYCQPSNPCLNRGQCYSTTTSFFCDCSNTGYAGATCAEPIIRDPCLTYSCLNGGTCLSNGASPTCLCANGYAGANCQIPPIPCVAKPCENGGTCQLITDDTYGCKCPTGFIGSQCEISVLANHPCVVNPAAVCQNGGTCIINNADYICRCATGWTGMNCQTRDITSTCNPSPCGVYGTCIETMVQGNPIAFCNCADRWTGKYCDVSMDLICPAGYCYSGGTCRMIGNTPYCDCPAGYTGQRCEMIISISTTTTITTTMPTTTSIDLCASKPCKNGGTCYSNNVMFTCNCPSPWSGQTCEINQMTTTTTTTQAPLGSVCYPDTCMNNGDCYVTMQGATCVCRYPWGGLRCNERIDLTTTTTTTTTTLAPGNPCNSFICSNGGTCLSNGVSAICNCPIGYTGTRCEIYYSTVSPMTTTPSSATCANFPCKNGGTCVPRGTSYSCFCGINSIYTGKNCDTTTPMPTEECPLNCAPGKCVFSGNAQRPYACLWNGIMRPEGGTTA